MKFVRACMCVRARVCVCVRASVRARVPCAFVLDVIGKMFNEVFMQLVVGKSGQISELRRYNPNIYRIKENHKAGALAKFYTFTSHRF